VVQLNHDFEPWLYVLDADWSDLIEISDVTRTVYISFDARASSSKQPKPQDHGCGASASRVMPVYSPAFAGTH